MAFAQEQLERVAPVWRQMLAHRFLRDTRAGTIAREDFVTWMRQDYLFVEAAIPFMAALMVKAPPEDWNALSATIAALQKELGLFEERAAAVGVSLRGVPPAFVTHAYVQFLMATAVQRSYTEAYTVLYAAEKAYYDSWRVVKAGIDPASPWFPFVEYWAGELFGQYVSSLETRLDALASAVGPQQRQAMSELFELTVRYEIAFWEMASTGEGWPGIS